MSQQKTLVWNLHTRLFHWLLLVVFTVSMATGLLGDIDLMEWHLISGYGVLALLCFRVLTGLFALDHAHFLRLPLSPRAVINYLRGQSNHSGHSPLGSWAVVIMLLTLLAQTLSGLLTTDEIFTEGPWVAWADERWISVASVIHANNYRLLLLLVALHLSAIGFYWLVRKNNLVKPMISGYISQQDGAQAAKPISLLRLCFLTAIAALSAWLLVTISP
ncbi:cytochrome b/b6 domain-containing protein [Oceanicoccus sagamiensis]|uniref:Cytochrome b561 bacterial/Ni-hydrogenase domain-containing protein n=1 Tax=Oceanicoccus sagamiensis TaxID=716816 RepID=A0A1X9NFU6_9GAMM|nr:cytochrome b/b6 domain-containing protein [Oceanicoccus sagamiensis]ARN75914.1 hypothetical protein BST96_18510 [Oceanicoccus sagamiensis]